MVSSKRKTVSLIAVLTVFVLFAWAGSGRTGAHTIDPEIRGGWQPGPEAYHPSRVIVRFRDSITTEAATDCIERLGYSLYRVASFKPTASFPNGVRFGIVELPEGANTEDAMLQLDSMPGILYAERDVLQYPAAIPNDPRFPELWGLNNHNLPDEYRDPEMEDDPVDDADIDAPEAWELYTGSDEVIVAVIDTGCYIFHPDLIDNIWVNPNEVLGNYFDDDENGYVDDIWGWDFVNNDNTVWDPDERDNRGDLNDEHGTHCAGTIGAMANNGMGVAGVNWNVKIMILKFIGSSSGSTSDAILAFEYAANNGAKVASCSWGSYFPSDALKDAIEASGMLVVCAAGNESTNTDTDPHFPSAYDCPNIISVGASMQNDEPCNYSGWWGSNYGATSVDLFAPGGYILSTLPPDPPPETPTEHYGYFYGTSMATPHVAGAAALVHGAHPYVPLYPGAFGWSPGSRSIKDVILDSVDVKPAYEGKCLSGGRLNVAKAVSMGGVPVITSVSAEPSIGAPPLEVEFAASALTSSGEITDKWWDFGDGSPAVHEYNTTHIYEELGCYEAVFHVVNDSGLESTAVLEINVLHLPVIGVEPSSIEATLKWGESCTDQIVISNSGLGELNYRIQLVPQGMAAQGSEHIGVLGFGGPDGHGYIWIDSHHPGGPEFEWNDITHIGTPIPFGLNQSIPVDLPFEFPFYGEAKTQVRICSNGYLTFGDEGSAGKNTPIPDPSEPNDLLAVFWDFLSPTIEGNVFYWGDEYEFIVQYNDVLRITKDSSYTFQVVLTRGGTIYYRYLKMEGDLLDLATIGIENSSGTDGLQVAFNRRYVRDNLTLMFVPCWISVDSLEGTVAPNSSQNININLQAHNLLQGPWHAILRIRSNDIENDLVEIGTILNVQSAVPPIVKSISATPHAGKVPLTVEFSAEAEDRDGTIVGIEWDFGDGSPHVTDTLTPTHTYTVEGEYDATLTVTDDDGMTSSATVHVVAKPQPKVSVNPASISRVVSAHETCSEKLTVTNVGDSELVFTAKVLTAAAPDNADDGSRDYLDDIDRCSFGGPDEYGYTWKDSDAPDGPVFEWIEISEIGTKLVECKENEFVEVDLPWTFPFYGQPKTKVKVNSNGFLTFGPASGASWLHDPIPDERLPNDFLAIWWDDLNPVNAPADGGVFYYYDDAFDRFIVEYKKVPRESTVGSYTFQAILYPNGKIVYQYLNMTFGKTYWGDWATIGIENADATDGLQVMYNEDGYIKNELAIEFMPPIWLSVNPGGATLEPGDSVELDVMMDSGSVESGLLDGAIIIETNSILEPRTVVPVHLEVVPLSPPIITEATAEPTYGEPPLEVTFHAAFEETDRHVSSWGWDFGDGESSVELDVVHIYTEPGVYHAVFTAVDEVGGKAEASIDIEVKWLPRATVEPLQIEIDLAPNGETIETITIGNVEGKAPLSFTVEPDGEDDAKGASIPVDPSTGTVPEGEMVDVAVTLNAANLGKPGETVERSLHITTNDPFAESFNVDITVNIESGPSIVSVKATPTFGEPPLKVLFDATVEPGSKPVTYIWWDFGDGSEQVHGASAEHIYNDIGTYVASVHAVDENDVEAFAEVVIEVAWLPKLEVNPDSYDVSVPVGVQRQEILTVTNAGEGPLEFEVSFVPVSSMLQAHPHSGYILAGESEDVILTFGSADADAGAYQFEVIVSSNDPFCPEVKIPFCLKVSAPPVVEVTAPASGQTLWGVTQIVWVATDPDDEADDIRVDLYWTFEGGEWNEIALGLPNSGSFEWDTSETNADGDTFRIRAVAADPSGASSEFVTEEFAIYNNLPPSVEIIKPTAGQVLTGEAMIEWEAVDPDDDADKLKITLEYEPASGGDWQAIASEVPNTGKYIWDTSKLERGGKYRIRIIAVDPQDACGEAISEEFTVIALTRMVIAAPNPANDLVTFYYDIDTDGELFVYDVAGRLMHAAKLSATANSHEWNLTTGGRPVASGLYLYVVVTDDAERSEVGRLVIERL